jgi:hypothetical protein
MEHVELMKPRVQVQSPRILFCQLDGVRAEVVAREMYRRPKEMPEEKRDATGARTDVRDAECWAGTLRADGLGKAGEDVGGLGAGDERGRAAEDGEGAKVGVTYAWSTRRMMTARSP